MDAVEILSVITTDSAQRLTSSEMDDAIAEAIIALESMPEYERLKERDRAKKPSSVDDEMGYFICPNCGGAIYYSDEKESQEFCLTCGQRIDWSEEGES